MTLRLNNILQVTQPAARVRMQINRSQPDFQKPLLFFFFLPLFLFIFLNLNLFILIGG